MATGILRMIVWNVKRGNAISLHLPNGKTVMIDCGNSDDCSPVDSLNKQQINKIDWLVISHPHTDHMADLGTIIRLGMLPTVLTTATTIAESTIKEKNQDQGAVETYLSTCRIYNSPLKSCYDPYNPENTGGVVFATFAPIKYAESNLNNRSLVVVAVYGGTKILFMGDCTVDAQRELLSNSSFAEAIKGTNVLIAPHHGHDSCYCQELMDVIAPWLCIVSDGKDSPEVSAVSKYGEHCSGIMFRNCNNERDKRVCLTTRNDGHITVDIPYCGGVYVQASKSGLVSC